MSEDQSEAKEDVGLTAAREAVALGGLRDLMARAQELFAKLDAIRADGKLDIHTEVEESSIENNVLKLRTKSTNKHLKIPIYMHLKFDIPGWLAWIIQVIPKAKLPNSWLAWLINVIPKAKLPNSPERDETEGD